MGEAGWTELVAMDVAAADLVQRTQYIQDAIDRAGRRGGGTVRVGRGVWEITTLFLRSGVRLHLEAGAVLQAAHDLSRYPQTDSHADNKDQSAYHLILARDCQDIAITGEGVIDGQDTAFWTPCEHESQRPYGIFRFVVPGLRLTPLVEIVRCRNVRIADVLIRRSPGWTLHCFDCDHVHIERVRMRNHLYGPNTDGIGINGSRDVIIRGCELVCGDDAIIIKATNPDSRCERVLVSDCIAESHCAAFGLGADVMGSIRDVTFTNCVARASLRMIQVEMWFPGEVENVVFSNIVGRTLPGEGITCERPIYVDIQQFNRPEPELGSVRNLQFANIICTTRGRIVLTAQDGSRIENVTLRDVHLDVPEIEDPQVAVPAARSMQLSNFNPKARLARAAMVADNVAGLRMDNLTVRWPAEAAVPMHGLWCRNVSSAVLDAPRLNASQPGVERSVLLATQLDDRSA